jgi:O-antigen/teichoic acid export membrane protein
MTAALRTGKNALMLFSGTALRMVATFVFIIYAANQLGVEGFGKYSIIVHFFELLVSLIASAAAILLTRDAAKWPSQHDSLFSSAVVLVGALALPATFVLIPLAQAFGYSQDTMWGLSIACVALLPASIAMLYEAIFVASERAVFVTAGVAIECLLRVTLSLWLLMLGYGILELSMVIVLSRVVLVVSYFFMLRCVRPHRWKFSRQATWRFFKRWRVFAAENWMATIYTSLDVIVLSGLAGETAVGLYSAAWRYVRLGAVAAKSFTTAVFPTLSRLYSQSRDGFSMVFRHTFRVMCLIALPVIAVVTVIPARVVDLIYTEEYVSAAPVLQVLIWMLLLEFLNPFLSHVLFSQGKQRFSMAVAAIGLVSNSLLMFLLVGRYGPVGTALACVLSGTIATVSYLYFASELKLLVSMLSEALRIFAAAASMGCLVYALADRPWWMIGPAAAGLYSVMLLSIGAVRLRDLLVIQQTFFRRAVV